MKKKTEEAYKAYIKGVIQTWVPRLNLQAHLIGIEKSDDHYLACRFRYPYQDTQILWSTKSFNNWKNDPDQEREIVHELCHILTDPLYAKATTMWTSKTEIEDEREKLTDAIALIFFKHFRKL